MSFSDAIKSVFSQYATFSGRARRSEYWFFTLFNVIISTALSRMGANSSFMNAIAGVYSLAVLIPGLAVTVRRLHDTGRSGWRILFNLIPIVGQILLIVWLAGDSVYGVNIYGPNPKGMGNEVIVDWGRDPEPAAAPERSYDYSGNSKDIY